MVFQLSDEQNLLIKKIAARNGFSNYEVITKEGSAKGDNYMGIITSVSIIHGNEKLELILKAAQPSEAFRKSSPIRKVFLREIFIYENVFTEFRKFQKEYNVSRDLLEPAKFYAACDVDMQECLILENLKENGYKLWNRKVPMNPGHIRKVMIEYGKFHAISLAMGAKKPKLYGELTKNLDNIFETPSGENDTKMEEFLSGTVDQAFVAAKGNAKATEALNKFKSELKKYFKEELNCKEDCIVITHGDCWNNNFMFQYEDPNDIGEPSKVCIIDWQLSKTGSPATDLAYFFYSSSPRAVLDDWKNYLKIYHDSVTKHLKTFHCDPDEIFPFSLLEYHWKKNAKYGLFLSLMIIRMMLAEDAEIPDFVERAEANADFENFYTDIMNRKGYNERILDIVESMMDQNLL